MPSPKKKEAPKKVAIDDADLPRVAEYFAVVGAIPGALKISTSYQYLPRAWQGRRISSALGAIKRLSCVPLKPPPWPSLSALVSA
jgi:hypothetical protein